MAETPLDRLNKYVQTIQGVKSLFEPSAYKQKKDSLRMARDEKILTKHLDRMNVTYDNDELNKQWVKLKQYYDSNLDGMNEEITYLFQEAENDFKNQYSDNSNYEHEIDKFKSYRDELSGLYENYVDVQTHMDNGTIHPKLYDESSSYYMKELLPYINTETKSITNTKGIPKDIKWKSHQDVMLTDIADTIKNGYMDKYVGWKEGLTQNHTKRVQNTAWGKQIEEWTDIANGALRELLDDNRIDANEYKYIAEDFTAGTSDGVKYLQNQKTQANNAKSAGYIQTLSDATPRLDYLYKSIYQLEGDFTGDVMGSSGEPITVDTQSDRDTLISQLQSEAVSLENKILNADRFFTSINGESWFQSDGHQSYIDANSDFITQPWLKDARNFYDEVLTNSTKSLGGNYIINEQRDLEYQSKNNYNFSEDVGAPIILANANHSQEFEQVIAGYDDEMVKAGYAEYIDGVLSFKNDEIEAQYTDYKNNVMTAYNDFSGQYDASLANMNLMDMPFDEKHSEETDEEFGERVSNYDNGRIKHDAYDYMARYGHHLEDILAFPYDGIESGNEIFEFVDFNTKNVNFVNRDDYSESFEYLRDGGENENITSDFRNTLMLIPDQVSDKVHSNYESGDMSASSVIARIKEIKQEFSTLDNSNILGNTKSTLLTILENKMTTDESFKNAFESEMERYVTDKQTALRDESLHDEYGKYIVPHAYALPGGGMEFESKNEYWKWVVDDFRGHIDNHRAFKEEQDNWETEFGEKFRNVITLGGYEDKYWEKVIEEVDNALKSQGFQTYTGGGLDYDDETIRHTLFAPDTARTGHASTKPWIYERAYQYYRRLNQQYDPSGASDAESAGIDNRDEVMLKALGSPFTQDVKDNFGNLTEKFEENLAAKVALSIENQLLQQILQEEFPEIYEGFYDEENQEYYPDYSATASLEALIKSKVNPEGSDGDPQLSTKSSTYDKSRNDMNAFLQSITSF